MIIVALIVGLIFIAVVKPWAFWSGGGGVSGGAEQGSGVPGQASRSEPPPTIETPAPVDPNTMDCLSSDIEQLVAIERWPNNEVRSWIAVNEASAIGPLDSRISRVAMHSSHVIGIGVCSPRALGAASGAGAWIHDVQAIVATNGKPNAVEIGPPDPIGHETGTAGWAVLYGPVVLPVSLTRPNAYRAWPIGSYGIAFTFPLDPTQQLHWLRIDIVPEHHA
jgi:hypothetical protein